MPGAAIDFDYVGRILLGLIGLYIVGNSFQYLMQYLMANVAQKTVYAMRREVEAKFDRLPLKFFDSRTRGEVMSRAVNDLDSISGTLQQNLTQLLTSALTLIGVIVMMLTISWILTLVIVLTLPLSIVVVARIAKRSQKFFMKQQMALGALNGHVAEMYGGHTIVTAFGHEKKSVATFDEAERGLLRRRVARAVRHRHHLADDDVRRQHRLRAGRGDRRRAGDAPLDCRSATCRRSSSTAASSRCRSRS